MGAIWDKLYLVYRKGPRFYYPFKQSAALPYENIGFYITEMALLREEWHSATWTESIFCSFSVHTALLSELIYERLLLNVLSEQIYKIIFRGFSGKEIAPFQLSWQGVALVLEQNRIVFYYTAMVNSSYPGSYPGLLRGKFSDSSRTD